MGLDFTLVGTETEGVDKGVEGLSRTTGVRGRVGDVVTQVDIRSLVVVVIVDLYTLYV